MRGEVRTEQLVIDSRHHVALVRLRRRPSDGLLAQSWERRELQESANKLMTRISDDEKHENQ